jgi:hypothetical protein
MSNEQAAKPEVAAGCSELAGKRVRHGIAIQRCPNATSSRTLRASAIAGVAGGIAGWLLTRHPAVRLGIALGAAAAGALASRYHVTADWDPDLACGDD